MSQRSRNSCGAIKWDSLPDPGPRFQLGERLGIGVSGEVFQATDLKEGNMQVAIKIQKITDENWEDLEEEYRVLKDHSDHPNLIDFYGAYCKKSRDGDQLWLVMQLCEGGSIIDLVKGLYKADKKFTEIHIAFVMKEVIKALIYLHQQHIMHRDIRGSNILLTKTGEVKLVDFGLSRELRSTMGKRGSSVGSPCWMAPELVTSEQKSQKIGHDVYDNRVDTWALGITAIEIADGKAPFEDIHPTRALFQIVRNPPPSFHRPANWSQIFNDFVNECLVKNPENRPVVIELVEHPFLTELPDNTSHLSSEIKSLLDGVTHVKKERRQEVVVRGNFLKSDQNSDPEVMYLEDLAALDNLTEDLVIEQLQNRLKKGSCYSFLGDVLLFLNPNETLNIYSDEIQSKYMFKSRSENRPHIYAVADCAYQDVLHHDEPQHIVLSGESMSGKTANMMHLLRHLLYLGKGNIAVAVRILNSMTIIHAVGNACTPINGNSTRHVLNTQVTFTSTGKVSGAIFWLYQLERWRITTNDRRQGNFHLFYYFYDAMEAKMQLGKYHLESGRLHRYLRSVSAPSGFSSQHKVPSDPTSASNNCRQYEQFKTALLDLEFGTENLETVNKILAAILVLGEVRFRDGGSGKAEIENPKISAQVAELLGIDEKKFAWALVNYCMIERGNAVKMQQSPEEAELARDALARALYSRLADWLVNFINLKLAYSRAVFGDRHMISILDLFGFECFQTNRIEQLFVNTLNEQLQYQYTQRLFAWEMQERLEDEVPGEHLTFYDNRPSVDVLMGKPDGIMWLIDEATRTTRNADFIIESINSRKKTPFLQSSSYSEFSVAHYTGKVSYEVKDMAEKNRDFIPPEITETLRLSSNDTVSMLFTNLLSRTGNLVQSTVDVTTAQKNMPENQVKRRASKWNAALVVEKQQQSRSYNTQSKGQFSQTRRMRTATTTFRAASLDILRSLNTGGTHFVRCLRAELTGQPRGFQTEVVRQQLRALGVVDTVRARQKGYPCRVVFSEFLRRYKFLAFDFDENVEMTGANCRLLMVRLKMEGYAMGKSKVYLKYYNEEYLARLYEQQVKKIIKVQSMMRAFLAKKKVGAADKTPGSLANAPANYGSGTDVYDAKTIRLLKKCCRRWRRRSLFQMLLLYRSVRQQDLVYFCQQVHMYNQGATDGMKQTEMQLVSQDHIKNVNRNEASFILGRQPVFVRKVPFQFHMLPFFDTSHFCDPVDAGLDSMYSDNRRGPRDYDTWDAPLRRNKLGRADSNKVFQRNKKQLRNQGCQTGAGHAADKLANVNQQNKITPHIQTPYRRELLDNQPKMPKKPRSPVPGPSTSAAASRPDEFSNDIPMKSVSAVRGKFESSNNYPARSGAKPAGHIQELKSIGKEMSGSDTGTFNFQGMLRKTNYNRGSMKRNDIYSPDDAPSSFKISSYNQDNSNMWEKNNVDQTSKGPSYSAVVKQKTKNVGFENDKNRHELAPGVIVEGDVADL
ncbi:neither inactivation nor afterpotential protein C isoform X2 [Neocloeon triangulifer]|uniref:neither inactivation nor afterpotential protein C isoform X2 n=1 Tax=Neocloeon triangulifer TaxID=2078957 RepID=UPI00286FAC89|nr:neither inactivation nor afterpotential protein C isoform X2 [Neocloeon triangulifer]